MVPTGAPVLFQSYVALILKACARIQAEVEERSQNSYIWPVLGVQVEVAVSTLWTPGATEVGNAVRPAALQGLVTVTVVPASLSKVDVARVELFAQRPH